MEPSCGKRIEAKIVQDLASDIASQFNEAVIIASIGDGVCRQGLSERVIQSLLEIRPLIHEACILLNATSVVRRNKLREVDLD